VLQARKAALPLRPVPEPPYGAAGKLQTKTKDRRKGLKGISLILLLGCFFFGLVVIAQYSSIVTLNYRLYQAETRIKELDEEYRQLEQQAARLSSLSRIETIARTELGMREPESGQLMVMTAGREESSSPGE
jgi:cell division protein FtsL